MDTAISAITATDGVTLQRRAYDELRRLIMQGLIAPGQKLSIRGAAHALGVSMMPVRAALQRLESEGALVGRGGKRVMGIPDLTADAYREIRAIRVELEGLAAERAAGQVTDAQVAATTAHCVRMQAAAEAGDRAEYIAANWDFHLSIYQACGMPTLVAMIEGLWIRVGPYVATMMPDRDALIRSMPAHWDIVAALKARDGRAARAGIASDIGTSGATLIAALERPRAAGKRRGQAK
ncbi:MAG: GntR family transcriptional regulator [Sphingomonadaceae bacterium]|nr:GntR family transcriptional regulator [Sphingomonadaceae bacterium]